MKSPMALRLVGNVLAVVVFAVSAGAATLTVTSLADAGAGSLRQAIAASLPGGTIDFAVMGTITLTSELVIGRDLTILGPGADSLTLDANQQSRVFNILEGVAVDISGLTVKGGLVVGGGVTCYVAFGGGVYNQGDLSMSSCRICGNTVINYGGPSCGLTWAFGGAIYNTSDGSLVLTNCQLSGNCGMGYDARGGAIHNNGEMVLTSCTLDANWVRARLGAEGGAICNWGTARITNCTFERNWAEKDESEVQPGLSASGGAIQHSSDGVLDLVNCTVVSNSCIGYSTYPLVAMGGGIRQGSLDSSTGSLSLGNTIVAGNTVSNSYHGSLDPGHTYVRGLDVEGDIVSRGFNLIGKTNASSGWVASDLRGSNNAPLDPLLGPLMDNGGPTPTMAPRPGSGAIDNGQSFGAASDQRGLFRTVDLVAYPNASGGDGTDIGAVEVQFEYVPVDIGLRASEGNHIIRIACEPPDPGGGLTSRLRIRKGTTTYGIILVEPDSTEASKIKIKTPSGIKAWRKLP